MQAAKRQWHLVVETVEARDRKVSFESTTCTTNGSGTLSLVKSLLLLEDNNTHDRYAVTNLRDLRISSLASFSIERSLTFYSHIAQFF